MFDQNKILDIDEIFTLDLERLNSSSAPKEIYNLILSLDKIKEPGVALNLIKKLNELLEVVEKEEKSGIKTNQSLLKKYQDDVTLLKFINLVGLADKEIEELFRMNLVFAIRSGIMVLDQVHHYITAYNNSAICSKFADSIIKAISYNEENLGSKQIFLETEKKPASPKLNNWIRSYNQSFNPQLRSIILQESEYLSTNKDVLKLSKEERKILEQVIKIYDFLRFPEQLSDRIVPVNILPDQSVISKLGKAAEVKVSSTKDKLMVGEEVLAAYQGDPRQVKAISKEQEKLAKKFGDDAIKLRAEFFKTVQKKDVNRTIALLRILAQINDLENFLGEDQKLNQFLGAIWEKQYGEDFSAQFRKNPVQLKFVRQFLRYVLESRLGLESSDAARIGLQIGNIFVGLGKKSYNKMAYFDVGKKEFIWFD